MDASGIIDKGFEKTELTIVVDDEHKQKRKRSPKSKQLRSVVWDHFDKLKKEPGEKDKAECKYCGQVYCCDPNANDISSMKTHLVKLCKVYDFSEVNVKKHDSKQKTLGFEPVKVGGDVVPKLTAVNFSVDACRKALAEMIILDELPFRFVESQGFKQFMSVVQPEWTKIPSRMTVAKDCVQLYKDKKKDLKKSLKDQRISLTTDTWTSLQNLNYMCLTAHFIDSDWKLHKKILNFCLVPNHKGETLGKMVEQCLFEWGINKFLTITVDNASSNSGLIDFLKKKTSKRKTTILDHEFLHVRCSAHILNLVVSEGLKDVDVSIARVRNIVKYVRSSPARFAKFRSCAYLDRIESKLVPCLDVATQWNSTYFMLERALIYQRAFERLEEEDRLLVRAGIREDEVGVKGVDVELEWEEDGGLCDVMALEKEKEKGKGKEREREREEEKEKGKGKGKGLKGKGLTHVPPNFHDWKVVEMYVKILKVFYIVTERFSSSLYVTCNSFFKEMMTIKSAINLLSETNDVALMGLAMGMSTKFDKYWGKFEKINPLLLFAHVLDPRYKFTYVKWSLKKYYSMGSDVVNMKLQEIKDEMIKLYNLYEEKNLEQGQTKKICESSCRVEKSTKDGLDFYEAMDYEFKQHIEAENNKVSKSDLERYWLETCENGGDNFDILAWWKASCNKYPILSQMARDILAIPVSTVASESAFSTEGRILDPYRTSLSPKVAEALICTQNWLRYPSHISLRDQLDEVEKLESVVLEAMKEDTSIIDW